VRKNKLWRLVILSVIYLFIPATGHAVVDCATAKPNLSIKSTNDHYVNGEQAEVFITIDTQSCYVKTPIEGSTDGGYKYTLSADCTCFDGISSEQWVYAISGNNKYWFKPGSGWLVNGPPTPFTSGPLSSLQDYPVLKDSNLSVGNYVLTYAIDNNEDQITDKSFSQEISVTIVENENCRTCHGDPDPSDPDSLSISERHHLLVPSEGLECMDCHRVINDGSGTQTEYIKVCTVCHNQPKQVSVLFPKPVDDISITQRHHTRATNEGWLCDKCHTDMP